MARWVSKRATRSARRMTLVALLGVLAVGVWGAFAVFATTGPPAPTVTSGPTTGTTVRSASFSYSEAYGSKISMGPQAMQGDVNYSTGDWFDVGFQLSIPSQHPASTVTLENNTFTFAVSCWDGSTPTSSSLVVTAPKTSLSIGLNDTGSYPAGTASAAATYEGGMTLPALCGSKAGNIRLKTGGTYTALLSSTDTTDKVQILWHYVDANTAKKGSIINCASLTSNPNPGQSVCNGIWSGALQTVPGTAQSSISFLCKLDSASGFTPCGTGSSSGSISYGPPSGSDLTVGSHTFQVEAVVASIPSAPTPYSWTIIKNTTTVTLTGPASPNAGSVKAGSAVPAASITATLGGAYTPATGAITFKVFGPSSTPPPSPCSGGASLGSPVPVSGNTGYHPTADFTESQVGNYWLYASYPTDSNNLASNSACPPGPGQEIVVNPATPSLSASAPATGTAGTTILASAFSAGLSNSSGSNATGTITFTLYGPSASATCTGSSSALGTASVGGNGSYSPFGLGDYTPHVAGTYWLYASYGGDTNNNGANSPCTTGTSQKVVVAPASPHLSVSAPSSLAAGDAVTTTALTATLSGSSGANATSQITFKYFFSPNSTPPSNCSGGTTVGTATPTPPGDGTYNSSAGFTPDTAGTYWWYVFSPADANNNAAASTCGTGMTSTVVSNPTGHLTISGDVSGLLYPGAAAQSIPVKLVNPNSVAVGVTSLNVSIDSGSLAAGCVLTDFVFTQSNVGTGNVLTVPPNGFVILPSNGVSAPTIRLKDNGNQDACKNATFTLTYTSN